MPVSKYAKLIVAALAAGAVALNVAVTDGTITGGEWVTIGLAALGALGVWAVPNSKPGPDVPPTSYRSGL